MRLRLSLVSHSELVTEILVTELPRVGSVYTHCSTVSRRRSQQSIGLEYLTHLLQKVNQAILAWSFQTRIASLVLVLHKMIAYI